MRAHARSYPLSKRARIFPFAAYRRSAPPQVALVRLKQRCLGCYDAAGFTAQEKRLRIFSIVGAKCARSAPAGMLRRALNISQTKRPARVQIRAGLSASHEACRRMAAFSIQLTESHTEPASHGACCATAVKPRPSRMSFCPPARQKRAEKGAGHSPASWMRPSSCRRMRLPVRGSPSSVGAEQVLEMWKR